MDKLSDWLRRAPFIRLLIPFAFGVVLGTSFASIEAVYLLAVFTGTFLFLVLFNKASFKIEIWFELSYKLKRPLVASPLLREWGQGGG